LIIIESISQKGCGKTNEDVLGICDNCFWVIDGVTAKTSTNFFSDISDSGYFANLFSKVLCKELKKNYNMYKNSKEVLLATMTKVKEILNKEFKTKEEKLLQPSFALAFVRISEKEVNLDILSDCYVIINYNDKIDVYTDKRINSIVKQTQKMREYILCNNIEGNIAEDMMRQQKIINRLKMNSKDGYWVGTIDGAAFNNTFSKEIKRPIQKILVCTDGYFKVFQNSICSYEDIFSRKISLKEALIKLRKFESSQVTIGEKKEDDATAILINIDY